MDQQQQQLYQYHLQSSQPYDQSQVQAYDPSYYTYNQEQQYGYYPQPYANDSQNQQQQPTSIHPPGVPIPPEPAQTVGPDYAHLQASHDGYYPQAVHGGQQQQHHLGYPNSAQAGSNLFQMAGNMDAAAQGSVEQWQFNNGGFGPGPFRPPIGQPQYRGGGRRGGRPFRRGGRSFRGGSYYPPHHAASTPNLGSVPTAEGPGALQLQGKAPEALAQFPAMAQHSNPSWRSPCMAAWCELCRVDCNTLEILEQHKNGKRHKKNLQVYQELQNLNKLITGVQNEQMPVSDFKPQVTHQPESVLQGSEDKQQPSQGTGADGSEKVQQTEVERSEVSAQPTEESEEMKGRMDQFQGPPGRGFKRKMRGVGGRGRGGGKRMHRYDEPPKPREMMIPLICELCNVKCESQVVFESHLAGKKHHSNLKRFHGYQAIIAGALQALIPSNNPNNAPPNFFIPQLHQQGASSSNSLGFPAQPMPPYMLQGQAPGFTPEPQPALVSVSVSASETHGKEDTKSVGGSQEAITKSGNRNSVVTVEAANGQLTMSEALSGVSETSASEEAKDVIRHPPPGMALSEDKVIG